MRTCGHTCEDSKWRFWGKAPGYVVKMLVVAITLYACYQQFLQ